MEIKAKKIDMVDVDALIPNPKNNNVHSKKQLERLKKIIKHQGFRNPITISNRSGFVCAGHARLTVAKDLGMKQVPVIYQDFNSEADEYAHMTADNEIARWAELNLDIVKLEIPKFENFDPEMLGLKSLALDTKPDEKENDVPEKAEPICKPGDLWQLGNHRLMCGDSTKKEDVDKLMCGQLADMWIADPPFGVSYMDKNAAVNGGIVKNQTGKEISSDTKSVEELCPFWKSVSENAYLFTTMEASNYWCACQGSDKMMMMMMMMMSEAGWNIRHELIWVKDSFVFGRSDYHYQHEPIIYGWKEKGKHNWYADRKQSSVLHIPRPHKSDLHPTTKPVELFENFIRNSTKETDLIFESFGGSGTSIIACEKLNRKCNTMELSQSYCDVIITRWEKFTGKKAERINSNAEESSALKLSPVVAAPTL